MEELSYDALVRSMEHLRAQAPFLRAEVFGRSLCGRALFALHFGSRQGGALVVAGFDGSRPAASAALLRWAETVARSVQTETPLCGVDFSRALQQSGVTVVPCLNPDGLEIAARGAKGAGSLRRLAQRLCGKDEPWRGNAAGVRLERQFPAAPDRQARAVSRDGEEATDAYPPLSQPEARALARLCFGGRFSRALLLEQGSPQLAVFPAAEKNAARETVVAAKVLAGCAGVPFLLPTAQESGGMFPPWFAEATGKTAFSLSLESEGEAFGRRAEEALVLFSVL